MATKFSLDIFKVLSDIDRGDLTLYRKLSDDEKKGFPPLVVMRWMTGTSDQAQIVSLNTFANRFIFPLGKHPELLAQLLSACSSKQQRRYGWLGIKSGKKKTLSRQAVQEYLEYSSQEMRKLEELPPDDEIIEMAEALGWQKDEIAKLKKELKDEADDAGSASKARPKSRK
jgi:predicted house-cleaning noncanonical NTP pyrophosphatase (MazG superfamily)